jgi:pimeloyl-ACP methyl ester carboxylesterase
MTDTPPGRTIELNGAALHYREYGEGPPLVLVHGGLVSSAEWAPVARELADGFRVITPDSRGHGRSTNPSGRLSYAALADDVAALKSSHPGGTEQWEALVHQTAPMWLGYAGLMPNDVGAIEEPVLVLAGDRDELVPLDLTLSLYRALPDAELAVCPQADHAGPTPERALAFAALIGDFAQRHTRR